MEDGTEEDLKVLGKSQKTSKVTFFLLFIVNTLLKLVFFF